MKANVYFTREITPEKAVELYRALGVELPGKVAVKVHSGEKGNQNFLRPERFPLKPLEGLTVLEVKYDDFLPELVRMAVQTPGRRAGACSKYALCRRFD